MGWFKCKPISQRKLTPGEVEAYNKGYDDGVGIVVEKLSALDLDAVNEEARVLIRDLILAHALETSKNDG